MAATSSLVEARPLDGRGIGLVALRDLSAGELLFEESPLLTLSQDVLADLATVEARRSAASIIARALVTLSKDHQRAFLGLSNCHPTTPSPGRADLPGLLGIWCTNGMTSLSGRNSVYPLLSRANHSCTPNAAYALAPAAAPEGVMRLRCVRDTRAGDEVLIAYTETTVPRDQRRAYLARQYGFACACPACEAPEMAVREADEDWRRGARARGVVQRWREGKAAGPLAVEAAKQWLDLLVQYGRYTQCVPG
jgi:hypothetical protein